MSKEKKSGMGKFVLGAALGAGLGILFAPKKGSETRKELKIKLDEMISNLKDVDLVEVRDSIQLKIEDLKYELEDLDKEKVLKIAKEKGKQLKEKSIEIYNLALEKGTPVLQKSALEIKEKTIEVVEEVLKKLKESNK